MTKTKEDTQPIVVEVPVNISATAVVEQLRPNRDTFTATVRLGQGQRRVLGVFQSEADALSAVDHWQHVTPPSRFAGNEVL